LKSLPALKSVYLNLFKEDQVDFIMRTLEDLDFLNGLKVERDILDEDDEDDEEYGEEVESSRMRGAAGGVEIIKEEEEGELLSQ